MNKGQKLVNWVKENRITRPWAEEYLPTPLERDLYELSVYRYITKMTDSEWEEALK